MSKINTIVVSLVIFLKFIAAQQAIACPTDTKSLEKAQQIWEQAISSLGGRVRILNIKTILSYNKDLTKVSLKALPDKFWWWSADRKPIGTNVSTYDFSKNLGYAIREGEIDSPSHPLADDSKERRLSGLLYTLLETKWIKPKLLGADQIKIDGKEYDVVCTEITFLDNQKTAKRITERHEYLFDRITHLVFRNIRYFDETTGGGNYTIEYSNYIDVKGIKFAREIRDKFSHDKSWNERREYITDIDVDYRKDLFDKPPSIADGPDGWRNKKQSGIYRRGGDVGMSDNLRLHEVTHLAYPQGPDLDISLADLLGVRYPAGVDAKQTGKNASDALNAYFKSNCFMKNRRRR